MQAILLALLEIIRPYIQTIGAVLSTILIKDSWRDAEDAQKRVEALEARISASNRIAVMSDADVDGMLRRDWSEQRKLRRMGDDKHKS